jgi:hypothetical protein
MGELAPETQKPRQLAHLLPMSGQPGEVWAGLAPQRVSLGGLFAVDRWISGSLQTLAEPSRGNLSGQNAGLALPRELWRAVGALGVGTALTLVFWFPLWRGGGPVGGDVYYYTLPQKAFYAQCLKEGGLPLWNNLVGNGYPQLAESQTGALYPPHLLLYGLLDLGWAYHGSLLLHYVLCFVFCWLFARVLGLATLPSFFAALVYTYSWFPPRISLEWSILGGAWLPLALWSAERFLQRRLWRHAMGLAVVLSLQMLSGHFLVAFLTQLLLVAFVPLRLLWAGQDLPREGGMARSRAVLTLAIAVAGSYLLAAAQLVPTWELKQHSQRATVTQEHNPGYGYIPPRYLAQIVAPWHWYLDEEPFQATADPTGPRTNRVEAHLYFGLLPLLLAGFGTWRAAREKRRQVMLWLVPGGAAVVYSTGCLVPLTNHLPGFSYFEGPGRYGIITTLAVAVLAGSGFQAAWHRLAGAARPLFLIVAGGATVADLYSVSRQVSHAVLVAHPPVKFLDASNLRMGIQASGEPVRMFNEGKNLPSLVGAGTMPVYLGLSPAQYYDPALMMPEPYPFNEVRPTAEQIAWLRRHGVTHLLSLTELETRPWPVVLAWFGDDRCLNPALARLPTHGFYLYTLKGSRGRCAWLESAGQPSPVLKEYGRHRVVVEAESASGGMLVLTDLAYPGWHVTVDGQPAEARIVEATFRGVALPPGRHTVIWTYRPVSVYWGAGISLASLAVMMLLGHVRFWHPHLLGKQRKRASTHL